MNIIYLNTYNSLIKLTRNKKLYNLNKKDTFYDRMIIFFFHLSFLLKNFKNKEKKDELQNFFDFCIRQIELSIREIGYGDATINKKMKEYVNLLFSIIDKINDWENKKFQEKVDIFNYYIEGDNKYDFYVEYFDDFSKNVSKNTFKTISKDIWLFQNAKPQNQDLEREDLILSIKPKILLKIRSLENIVFLTILILKQASIRVDKY